MVIYPAGPMYGCGIIHSNALQSLNFKLVGCSWCSAVCGQPRQRSCIGIGMISKALRRPPSSKPPVYLALFCLS